MKERRKPPRKNRFPAQGTGMVKKVEELKKPLTSQTLIQVPPGEDDVSFQRHNRLLSIEYSKTKKNETVVKELMKFSYAMRRNDIIENGHTFSIIEKYPFLQTPEHVRYNNQNSASIMFNNMCCR